MKTIKKIFSGAFLIALIGGGGYTFWWWNDGVSHREICNTVKEESGVVQSHIDKRCDILGAQCDIIDTRCGMIDMRGREMDEKLDRIEAKLDELLKLATAPQLPDGLQPAAY
jgi:hypothetical protein